MSKVKLSRKVLFKDNCKMRDEIETLVSINLRLKLEYEQARKEINDANERIEQANRIIDKSNFEDNY